jgi:hypothetical protein
MKQVHIYYKVDPDSVETIVDLVNGVYAELEEAAPAGYSSETFQLEAPGEFVQVASLDDETHEWPSPQLAAFKPFEAALAEHGIGAPLVIPSTSIARYAS